MRGFDWHDGKFIKGLLMRELENSKAESLPGTLGDTETALSRLKNLRRLIEEVDRRTDGNGPYGM